MKRPEVVAVSLLCLLSFATSASAECAWVLWVHETVTYRAERDTRTSGSWETIAASSSELGCNNTLREQMAKVSRLNTANPPQGEKMYYKFSDGQIIELLWYREAAQPDDLPLRTQTLSYSCLPTPWTRAGRRGSSEAHTSCNVEAVTGDPRSS